MTRWPWITGVVAPIAAISPLGQEVLHGSFLSGEQLARSISQFLLTVGIAILAGLALLEWRVRILVARRRATQAEPAPLTDAHSNTET